MSIKEIRVGQIYKVTCTSCGWQWEDCPSAGEAENSARDHIEHEYNHEVTILPMTVMSRWIQNAQRS